MNRKVRVGGTVHKGFSKASQRIVERMEILPGTDQARVGLSKVVAVYPDRMACDIETPNGMKRTNVPILTRCGLEADEVWGEMELPSVNSYVLVGFIEGRETFPVILGTIFPYAYSKYQKGQTTVNSTNKAFTTKVLEDIDPKVYRRVFKGGTTVEVAEDGKLTIETPSGSHLLFDETNKKVILIMMDAGTEKCRLEMAAGELKITQTTKVTINGNLEVLA